MKIESLTVKVYRKINPKKWLSSSFTKSKFFTSSITHYCLLKYFQQNCLSRDARIRKKKQNSTNLY